jgi:hypothetical protein
MIYAMRLHEIVLPVILFALLAFAVRWQYHRVVHEATSADQTNVFPISTPFTGGICGFNNRNCTNLKFDYYEP